VSRSFYNVDSSFSRALLESMMVVLPYVLTKILEDKKPLCLFSLPMVASIVLREDLRRSKRRNWPSAVFSVTVSSVMLSRG
jgi:hypothetical protein